MSETTPRPLVFRKSSYSANSANCVEVGETAAAQSVAVRDSKTPTGHLSFAASEWQAFLVDVKSDKI
ncbi:DUF397 domain-containing protein [Nocardiopsis baichengensis]|uniref:DUF397 domain-containing protein n=1 Tax=Nocardiopsis baichengensis TaxID=280240 RepID=UPI000346C933|nr:DUF397 domain-containing protein [Nocardiopsis baichengensis]